MEFVRKRVRGKAIREWLSDDGHYRIVWRREVYGVKVRPGFHPLVRSINSFGFVFWSFAAARRPYKTLELAKEACEKNHRLWTAFCNIAQSERKGRADRVRALDAKATIGTGAAAHKVMSVLPIWVKAAAEPFLIRIMFPVGRRQAEDDECENDPPSQPEASQPSEPDSSPEVASVDIAGPALPAKEKVPSVTQPTDARPAKVRAKARKPKSKRPTKRRSKATAAA